MLQTSVSRTAGALFLLLLAIAAPASVRASHKMKKQHSHAKTTTASSAELCYDLKHLTFQLHITDTSTFVVGDVNAGAVVTADTLSQYAFELDSTIVIDSAKFNGAPASVNRAGDVSRVLFPATLSAGTYFNAEVFYHGVPPASGGFFTGLTYATSSGGTKMVYSVSDPYAAQDWWPAKQCIDDKIDTVDMFVRVPAGVRDGSNGELVGVDSASQPGFWIFHWQTHCPIDYYLISIAAARYVESRSYMHFTGSTDSMLIQNFFYDTTTFYPEYKAEYDSIGQIIDYFSSLFGRYPFWKEKYGMCYTNLPGGMEHQTMTTIGNPYPTFTPWTYIIAHELCHQWFGDHVTYQQWGDTWLSEGFATFAEQLFYNHFWSAAAAKNHRLSLYNAAMSNACGHVWVSDTLSADSLFYQRLVYDKGMAVVNMLRYAAPVDSLFFTVLQTYQSRYSFGNANTNDLKAIADSVYGTSLDTFFNQWIYGQGFPEYRIWWNQTGSNVYLKLVQTASCAATTPLFHTFLELQLHSATADTFVKVYNSLDTQIYTFHWDPTMTTLYLNPDVWTLCKLLGTVVLDTTLGTQTLGVTGTGVRVYPNPTCNYWDVSQLPAGSRVYLIDALGNTVWQGESVSGMVEVPGLNLAAGLYTLKYRNATDSGVVRLTRW
jgi:aminopeptidase N